MKELKLENNWDKTFKKSDKELIIIPNAVRTDLYDSERIISFDKIESFFKDKM